MERWEGTLEYTFMAPIRRWTQLLGSCLYAMVYGLVHTGVILIVMMVFFRELDPTWRTCPPPRCSCCSARSASSASG